MKYKPEDYSLMDSGFYGFDDTEIKNYKEKLVKCRKPHKCTSCEKEIPVGNHAIRETGFMDGKPMTNYVCTDCMDEWLDELLADEVEEDA